MPLIRSQYIDTGKVYFIFRDLPLTSIHPGALQAAHAANCAAEQGRFWEMHGLLFAGQSAGEWGNGSIGDARTFGGYAAAIGADVPAFEACLSERRHAPQIEADMIAASERGLGSTPSYFVNGQRVIGARSFESWKQIFDSLLASS